MTVELTNQDGAVANPAGPFNGVTATIIGDGEFDVTFTSLTAGQVVGNATGSATPGRVIGHAITDVTVDGVILHRETDGAETVLGSGTFNSDDAITIAPDDTNEVGDDHIKDFEDDFEGLTPGFWKGTANNALRRPGKFAVDAAVDAAGLMGSGGRDSQGLGRNRSGAWGLIPGRVWRHSG